MQISIIKTSMHWFFRDNLSTDKSRCQSATYGPSDEGEHRCVNFVSIRQLFDHRVVTQKCGFETLWGFLKWLASINEGISLINLWFGWSKNENTKMNVIPNNYLKIKLHIATFTLKLLYHIEWTTLQRILTNKAFPIIIKYFHNFTKISAELEYKELCDTRITIMDTQSKS